MKILVAGIGNIFLGDDGFGVEVARRLAERAWPEGVRVVDFGIRGIDLVYALLDDYEALILVDIAARGEPPGTLYLIDPQVEADAEITIEAHSMDPMKVLALARDLGAPQRRLTYLVACEPAQLVSGETYEDVVVALSAPVAAAVDEAVKMVESLVAQISNNKGGESDEFTTLDEVCGHRGGGDDGGQRVARPRALFEDEVDVEAMQM
jgi:hydrogenase maturation protease